MPKLMIKTFGYPGEDVCELEQAGYFLNFNDRVILVDGQRVHSCDELIQLAARDKYQDKEYIEVVQLPAISGG